MGIWSKVLTGKPPKMSKRTDIQDGLNQLCSGNWLSLTYPPLFCSLWECPGNPVGMPWKCLGSKSRLPSDQTEPKPAPRSQPHPPPAPGSSQPRACLTAEGTQLPWPRGPQRSQGQLLPMTPLTLVPGHFFLTTQPALSPLHTFDHARSLQGCPHTQQEHEHKGESLRVSSRSHQSLALPSPQRKPFHLAGTVLGK